MNTNIDSDNDMMIANLTCDVFFANKNTFEKEHQGQKDLGYILSQYKSYGFDEDEILFLSKTTSLFELVKDNVLIPVKGNSVRIEDVYLKITNLIKKWTINSIDESEYLQIIRQAGDGKMLGCLISVLVRYGYKLSIVPNHLFTTVVVDDVALC